MKASTRKTVYSVSTSIAVIAVIIGMFSPDNLALIVQSITLVASGAATILAFINTSTPMVFGNEATDLVAEPMNVEPTPFKVETSDKEIYNEND